MELLCAGAILLVCAVAAASINSEKGRSGGNGFLAGLFLGPLGLIIVLLLPPNQEVIEHRQIESGKMKRCPFCRDVIPTGATVCGRCGRQLATPPKVMQAPRPLSREEQGVRDAQHWLWDIQGRLTATRQNVRMRQAIVALTGVLVSTAVAYVVGAIWEVCCWPFARGRLVWVLPASIVEIGGLTGCAALAWWIGRRTGPQTLALQAEFEKAKRDLQDSNRRLEETQRHAAEMRERQVRRLQREQSVRPGSLSEFIGQSDVVERIKVAMAAADVRGQALDHILLAGPSGCGKETLAGLVAKEMSVEMKTTSGDAYDWDLIRETVVSQTSEPEIIFVRRLDQLSQTNAEYLSRAMGHRGLSLPDRTARFKMFTLIGSTTDAKKVSEILRTTFPIILNLTPYDQDSIAAWIERYAWAMEVEVDQASRSELANRAGGQLLEARHLLKQVADYAVVHTGGKVSLDVVVAALGGKTSA